MAKRSGPITLDYNSEEKTFKPAKPNKKKVALVDDTGESYGRGGIPDPVDKKGPKKWI